MPLVQAYHNGQITQAHWHTYLNQATTVQSYITVPRYVATPNDPIQPPYHLRFISADRHADENLSYLHSGLLARPAIHPSVYVEIDIFQIEIDGIRQRGSPIFSGKLYEFIDTDLSMPLNLYAFNWESFAPGQHTAHITFRYTLTTTDFLGSSQDDVLEFETTHDAIIEIYPSAPPGRGTAPPAPR